MYSAEGIRMRLAVFLSFWLLVGLASLITAIGIHSEVQRAYSYRLMCFIMYMIN